jgi:hypothetical protein
MTGMFHDIHRNHDTLIALIQHRLPAANFDEIMYADDTICISSDTKAVNKFIQNIEAEGEKYNMKLNREKCEVIHNSTTANVHFADNTKVKRKEEAKYLGCNLNPKANIRREISNRISTCMHILKKLHIFWRNSNCPTKFKLLALDAVIRSKLLYGLESAVLSPAELRRIDVFQRKGIRKILRWKTTYVERNNSNSRLLEEANKQLQEEGKKKKITTFAEAHRVARIKRLAKIIRSPQNDIIRNTTMTANWNPIDYPNKRVGGPKKKWVVEALSEFWQLMQKTDMEIKHTPLDTTLPETRTRMTLAAENLV